MNGLGQQKISLKNLDAQGVIDYLVFDNSESYIPLGKAKQLLQDSLKLQKKDEIILVEEIVDELGFTHQSYEQHYNGIKIEDGRYGVCAKNGKIEYIGGEFKKVGDISTIPLISEKEALGKALDYIKAAKYSSQVPLLESDIKTGKKDSTGTFYSKGAMIICKDVIVTDSMYRLAYKFKIAAFEPYSHRLYYIDAITGDLLDVRDLLFFSNTPATAALLYSTSQVNIMTEGIGYNTYRLHESRPINNVIINTYNANHSGWLGPPPTNPTDITNTGTYWSADGATDVHWRTEKVIDYWQSVRQRNSLDNAGMAINSFVHYGDGPLADNAGWDNGYDIIVYGDGFQRFKHTGSLDFIAHETAHGIMKYTAVFQSNRENPSLNEGFSDIWAAVIEHWVAPIDPNKNNWKISEQTINNGRDCLRSLRSPKTEGYNSITGRPYQGGYPNTYNGTYWVDVSGCTEPSTSYDKCYCHNNSTVLSHWFYLLSEGGVATNDKNNHYEVWGLGIDKAADIVWYAQRYNLPNYQTAQYTTVMQQIIGAAETIYGQNSLEVMQVRNAWYAVGFGDTQPIQMRITGNTFVCRGGTTYTIENYIQGCSVSWSKSPNITLTPTGNQNSIVASHNSSGTGWVQATVTSPAPHLNSVTLEKFYVTLETDPYLYYILPEYGNYYGYEGNSYSFHVWPETYPNYTFSIYPPYAYINWVQGAVVNIYFPYPDIPFTISAYTTDESCKSNTVSMPFYVYGMYYSLSPNPASNEITIIVTVDPLNNSINISKADQFYDVSILDINGILKIRKTCSGERFSIPIHNLKDGEYLVRINDGKTAATKRLIIKH